MAHVLAATLALLLVLSKANAGEILEGGQNASAASAPESVSKLAGSAQDMLRINQNEDLKESLKNNVYLGKLLGTVDRKDNDDKIVFPSEDNDTPEAFKKTSVPDAERPELSARFGAQPNYEAFAGNRGPNAGANYAPVGQGANYGGPGSDRGSYDGANQYAPQFVGQGRPSAASSQVLTSYVIPSDVLPSLLIVTNSLGTVTGAYSLVNMVSNGQLAQSPVPYRGSQAAELPMYNVVSLNG